MSSPKRRKRAASGPARQPRGVPRGVWVIATIAASVAIAGFVLVTWLPAGLPPVPNLSRPPAAMKEAVLAADSQARAWLGNPAAIADLGRLYHANGYTHEARTCWELLSRKQPGEGRWPYYLADLDRTAGDEDMAGHLQEALRRDPGYATGWLRLADFCFKTGRPDEAAAAYRRRLELAPGDPYARLGLARLALQQGRHDEAKGALETLVRDLPDFPSAQNLFAELLAQDGDEAGAARHRWQGLAANRFREADDPWLLELRPHCYDVPQLLVWGSQEEQTGQADRARLIFERAMALAPEDPVAYAELGQMLLDSGEPARALEVLERGAARAPFHEKLCQRLSMALRELGRAQEALQNDQRGLERAPESIEILNSLGQSQLALGRHAEAEASFQAALQRSPHAVVVQYNLGILYFKTGRRDEARRLWETALEGNAAYPKLLIALGGMALEDSRLDDAERFIRPYFQHYPGNARAQSMLAQLHLARASAALNAGDAAAAERWCTTGLADVPSSAELLGLLGSIALQNGNIPKALDAMETFQRTHPGDPRAVMPLAMLYRQLNRPADARRVLIEAKDWLKSHGGAANTGQIDALLRALPAP